MRLRLQVLAATEVELFLRNFESHLASCYLSQHPLAGAGAGHSLVLPCLGVGN